MAGDLRRMPAHTLPLRSAVAAPSIYPAWLRAMHWINAAAFFVLVHQGYNWFGGS